MKKNICKFTEQLTEEYKWIDNEFRDQKKVSVLEVFKFDEKNKTYKYNDNNIYYTVLYINYKDIKNNQLVNILYFLLKQKLDKKIIIIISYSELKNIYNNLNEILNSDEVPNYKIKHKYFEYSLMLILESNISDIKNEINLRKDKISLANKLMNSYEKEEYFLNYIKNNLKKKEIGNVDNLGEIIYLRKEKVELSKILLQSYQKEEYLLNAYNKLLKQYNIINKKYDSLSNSKLGKLTIGYWKLKNKKR